MSYKETRELAQLPQEIEALEQEQNALTAAHELGRLSQARRRSRSRSTGGAREEI